MPRARAIVSISLGARPGYCRVHVIDTGCESKPNRWLTFLGRAPALSRKRDVILIFNLARPLYHRDKIFRPFR